MNYNFPLFLINTYIDHGSGHNEWGKNGCFHKNGNNGQCGMSDLVIKMGDIGNIGVQANCRKTEM